MSAEAIEEDFLNEAELQYFKEKLLQMREDIWAEGQATVNDMQEESTLYPDPNDRASLEAEHFNTLRIRDRERKLLTKIDAALQRIEDGTFGICEVTGAPIERKRLEARPVTTLSLKAKQEQELEEQRHRR
jgi:DnaK suppressor protein